MYSTKFLGLVLNYSTIMREGTYSKRKAPKFNTSWRNTVHIVNSLILLLK